jgi:chromosome segregation ATPase
LETAVNNNANRKVADNKQLLDELLRAEAATNARLETAAAELAQREARDANLEPSDTPATLAQIEKDLADARRAMRVAKANHDRAVNARQAAEAESALTEDRRARTDLERRLDEAAKRAPEYRQLAERLLALVAGLHQLDSDVATYNKMRPAGVGILSNFEQRVRWTEPCSDRPSGINPVPIYTVFEIPALRRGDQDYRVPGTMRPGGIWIDVNGTPRQ